MTEESKCPVTGQMRKPISGKEAASIAGILKAIKTTAGNPTPENATASSASGGLKPLIMALSVGAVIAISVFVYNAASSGRQEPPRPMPISVEQPIITIKTPENDLRPVEKVTDTEEKATISSTTAEEIGNLASETTELNGDIPVEDDAQIDSQQHPQAHVVSPDQEEVINSE